MSDELRKKMLEEFDKIEPRYSDVDPVLDDTYQTPPHPEGDTYEEHIAWLTDVATHAPNPSARATAETQAILLRHMQAQQHRIDVNEVAIRMLKSGSPELVRQAINLIDTNDIEFGETTEDIRADYEAMINKINAVPKDEWDKWCSIDQHTFIRMVCLPARNAINAKSTHE